MLFQQPANNNISPLTTGPAKNIASYHRPVVLAHCIGSRGSNGTASRGSTDDQRVYTHEPKPAGQRGPKERAGMRLSDDFLALVRFQTRHAGT